MWSTRLTSVPPLRLAEAPLVRRAVEFKRADLVVRPHVGMAADQVRPGDSVRTYSDLREYITAPGVAADASHDVRTPAHVVVRTLVDAVVVMGGRGRVVEETGVRRQRHIGRQSRVA